MKKNREVEKKGKATAMKARKAGIVSAKSGVFEPLENSLGSSRKTSLYSPTWPLTQKTRGPPQWNPRLGASSLRDGAPTLWAPSAGPMVYFEIINEKNRY